MTILLFILSIAALAALYLAGRRAAWLNASVAVMLLLTVAGSLALEGWRWPRVLLWLWASYLSWRLLHRSPSAGLGRVTFAVGVLVSYCTLNLAQQVIADRELPPLRGPHAVAKQQWVIQSQRQESHSPDPFAKREFLVNVYYPTVLDREPVDGEIAYEIAGMHRAPYLSPAMLEARFLQDVGPLRRFVYASEMRGMRSRAWAGFGTSLSPIQEKYPVVVFSPGLTWFADMHSFYLEQLASHGYAVFAITHPGYAPLVEYPDGRHFAWGWSASSRTEDPTARRERENLLEERRREIAAMLEKQGTPSASQLREWTELNAVLVRNFPLSSRKDDVIELLDRLERLNGGEVANPFAGRLDLQNLALTGMSYGGPTVSEACLEDARCKVIVNLDGGEYGRLLTETNTRPALWLSAEHSWSQDFSRRIVYDRYAGPAYRVDFAGAAHESFSDLPFFWPPALDVSAVLLPRWLLDRARARAAKALPPLILEYELDFLDHYLKGRELKLLNGTHSRRGTTLYRKN